jgi:hypothetical protein
MGQPLPEGQPLLRGINIRRENNQIGLVPSWFWCLTGEKSSLWGISQALGYTLRAWATGSGRQALGFGICDLGFAILLKLHRFPDKPWRAKRAMLLV